YVKPEDVIPVPSLNPKFLGLLVSGLTATIGLDELGRIQKGDKVLITASAGGTGHIGVQWAKRKGAYVIGLTSSPEKAKLLTELGTDRVITYKTENLDEVLTKEFPHGVDVIWETIGGQVYETLFNHLAPKGRLLIIGSISGQLTWPTIDNLNMKLLSGSRTLSGFNISDHKALFGKHVQQLIGDVVNNKLRVVLDLGQNTSEGEFVGIESVVSGVEVQYMMCKFASQAMNLTVSAVFIGVYEDRLIDGQPVFVLPINGTHVCDRLQGIVVCVGQ
ncbi:unnamed protein product, partial [Oppiella nova]